MPVAPGNTPFTVTLPDSAVRMLEELVPIGLYGRNRADVARSLILDALKQLVRDKIVSVPPA